MTGCTFVHPKNNKWRESERDGVLCDTWICGSEGEHRDSKFENRLRKSSKLETVGGDESGNRMSSESGSADEGVWEVFDQGNGDHKGRHTALPTHIMSVCYHRSLQRGQGELQHALER